MCNRQIPQILYWPYTYTTRGASKSQKQKLNYGTSQAQWPVFDLHRGEQLSLASLQTCRRQSSTHAKESFSWLFWTPTYLSWGPRSAIIYMVCMGVLMTWLFLMKSSEGSQVMMWDLKMLPSLQENTAHNSAESARWQDRQADRLTDSPTVNPKPQEAQINKSILDNSAHIGLRSCLLLLTLAILSAKYEGASWVDVVTCFQCWNTGRWAVSFLLHVCRQNRLHTGP